MDWAGTDMPLTSGDVLGGAGSLAAGSNDLYHIVVACLSDIQDQTDWKVPS